MKARIIASHHPDIPNGSTGTITEMMTEPIEGFAVLFPVVENFLHDKRKNVTAFFPKAAVEVLPDTKTPENGSTPAEAPPPATELKICGCNNPLLNLITCQLPPGHKGRHRADVNLIGTEQTFNWE